MSQGFNIAVSAADVAGINADAIAAELAANGQQTAKVRDEFIPAALTAATALATALAEGPFSVNIYGVDRTATQGEFTVLTVTVSSFVTTGEPAHVVSEPAPSAVVNETTAVPATATAEPTVLEATLAEPAPADTVPNTEVLPEGSAPSAPVEPAPGAPVA